MENLAVLAPSGGVSSQRPRRRLCDQRPTLQRQEGQTGKKDSSISSRIQVTALAITVAVWNMIAIMSEILIAVMSRLAGRQRVLSAHQVLFRVGDRVRSIFIVEEGAVQLVRTLPQGSELTLQRAGPGTVLAEASLFAETYHCDAVASLPSTVRAVSRRRLEAALAEDRTLSRLWARHLAGEVQKARAVAELLSLKTVAERVDAWLVLNSGTLPPRGSWRLLASEIGVTSEAVYRELAVRRLRSTVCRISVAGRRR
jgi:CRP/FNR family transcriptional regulator, dissimilatory nitrate respiration regulator